MCSRSLWQALVESGLPPALLGQLYIGGGDKRGHPQGCVGGAPGLCGWSPTAVWVEPQGCVGGAPGLAGPQAFWRASSVVSEDENG